VLTSGAERDGLSTRSARRLGEPPGTQPLLAYVRTCLPLTGVSFGHSPVDDLALPSVDEGEPWPVEKCGLRRSEGRDVSLEQASSLVGDPLVGVAGVAGAAGPGLVVLFAVGLQPGLEAFNEARGAVAVVKSRGVVYGYYRVIRWGLGGECGHGVGSDLGFGGGDDVDAAAGEDVELEVAAASNSSRRPASPLSPGTTEKEEPAEVTAWLEESLVHHRVGLDPHPNDVRTRFSGPPHPVAAPFFEESL